MNKLNIVDEIRGLGFSTKTYEALCLFSGAGTGFYIKQTNRRVSREPVLFYDGQNPELIQKLEEVAEKHNPRFFIYVEPTDDGPVKYTTKDLVPIVVVDYAGKQRFRGKEKFGKDESFLSHVLTVVGQNSG